MDKDLFYKLYAMPKVKSEQQAIELLQIRYSNQFVIHLAKVLCTDKGHWARDHWKGEILGWVNSILKVKRGNKSRPLSEEVYYKGLYAEEYKGRKNQKDLAFYLSEAYGVENTEAVLTSLSETMKSICKILSEGNKLKCYAYIKQL